MVRSRLLTLRDNVNILHCLTAHRPHLLFTTQRHRCFSCFVISDLVEEWGCEHTAECEGTIWLCAGCKALRRATPCPLCWVADVGVSCYCCGAAVDTEKWRHGRRCDICTAKVLGGASCFACFSRGLDVEERACQPFAMHAVPVVCEL